VKGTKFENYPKKHSNAEEEKCNPTTNAANTPEMKNLLVQSDREKKKKKSYFLFLFSPLIVFFGKLMQSFFFFDAEEIVVNLGKDIHNSTFAHKHTHKRQIYIYNNMYIKLDPRSPFDNFVIEPPTSSSLLQWRMGISRKRRSKGKNTHTHLINHARHTTVGNGRKN
jgi:hypothetical protein